MYKELMFDRPYYGTPEHYYNEYLRKHQAKQNKGARTKDSERQKTYEAEWAFQAVVNTKEFKDIAEAKARAKAIYKTAKWQKAWELEKDTTQSAKKPTIVAKQRSSGRGTAGWATGNMVVLDEYCGLNEYTLLHELTHCLGHMHHGRSFRRCLLELVGAFMGTHAKKVLKGEFKKRKLACGAPRKPMTFEQWNAARLRMETMRDGNQ